jgi:hypothetical protein
MTGIKCPIWGTPAQLIESAGDYQVVDSPRAGGKYWLSGTANGQLMPLNDLAKRLLTSWLCEQRRAGVETPRVESGVLDLIQSRRPLSIPKRMELALLFVGRETKKLGDFLTLTRQNPIQTIRCVAETESHNADDLGAIFHLLKSRNLVDADFFVGDGLRTRPTVSGWEAIEQAARPQSDYSQGFVAMWFDPKTEDAYGKGIYPAIEQSGYKPFRIDKKEHNNKIDDEIIAEIRRSRFVVADFTSEPDRARGGVYYEAGFAHGLGIPVIWTCDEDSLKYLHFDTRQYAHIVWKTPADLFQQLKNRIGATIGDGPLPKKA